MISIMGSNRYNRLIHINIIKINILAFISILIFALFKYLHNLFFTALIELIISIGFLFNAIFYIRTKKLNLASNFILILSGILFLFVFYNGEYRNTGIYWSFIFPIGCFYLKGSKNGLLWTLSYLILTLIIFVLSKINLIKIPYNDINFVFFFIALTILSIFVFIANSMREMAENITIEKINELEIIKEELKLKNETVIKALKEEEKANKFKSEFLAITSHELRTPLTTMLGYSQLLTDDNKLDASQKKYAKYIYRSGERLLTIINDILEISLIEAGIIKIEYSSFNINNLIDDIFLILENLITNNKNKFHYDIFCDPIIYSDPQRIRQILLNLLGNASKFTEKGDIFVSIREINDDYVFEVKDTGIGINKIDLTVIFDIFKQVDSTSSRKYGGLGIGLAICKKLIESLNGKISVESEYGIGTKFSLIIPKIEKPGNNFNDEIKVESLKSDIIKKELIKVLFAEDDECNLELIKNYFELKKNYVYKAFNNGKELLEEFYKNKNYDVIILDIQMSEMNGIDCMLNIRKINKNIPIIALSANVYKNCKQEYKKLGFTDYIPKPVDIEYFFEIIENSLF